MDGNPSDTALSIEPRPTGFTKRFFQSGLLKLTIGLIVLAFLFSRVPLSEVLLILRHSDLHWVVAGFSAAILVQWTAAKRLKIFTDLYELGLTHWEVFKINLAARFYGLFIPGGHFATVAIRIFKLAQVRRRFGGAIMAMGMDRVFATLTLTFVGVGFWFLDRPPHSVIWLLVMAVAFLGLVVLLTIVFSRNQWPNSTFVKGALSRLALGQSGNLGAALNRLLTMPRANLVRVLVVSVLSHLVGIASYAALAESLDLSVSLFAIGWIRSALILATMIPVSVSGLGLREGAALLILPAYGIATEEALAFSLLVFAITTLLVGLLGGMIEGRWFLNGTRN